MAIEYLEGLREEDEKAFVKPLSDPRTAFERLARLWVWHGAELEKAAQEPSSGEHGVSGEAVTALRAELKLAAFGFVYGEGSWGDEERALRQRYLTALGLTDEGLRRCSGISERLDLVERAARLQALSEPAKRESLGRLVRETWVAWAREQDDPKPHWLSAWEELDEPMREVDRRIGVAVATRVIRRDR